MSHTIQTSTRSPLALRIAAFAIVYVVWGSTYLGIRIGIETLPPFLMAGTRFLLAGLPLYLVARWRGATRPTAAHWRGAALAGTLMLFGGNGLVTWSEQHIASGLAAVLIATVPLWMAVLDAAFFRGPRLGVLSAAGIVLGVGGVGVLVSGAAHGSAPVDAVGTIVCVAAAFFWALGSLASRRATLPASPWLLASMQMLAGGTAMLVAGSLTGEWARVDVTAISTRSILALVYLALFGSIVALSAYVWLLRNATAAAVSTYAFVNPVVAVVLGWAFAGERLDGRTALASLLILAAVLCLYGVRVRQGTPGAPAPCAAPRALPSGTSPATAATGARRAREKGPPLSRKPHRCVRASGSASNGREAATPTGSST